jgi:hypothetical protein
VKVACWQDPRFGPAFVALLDARDGEPPQVAAIPRCPPGPARQFAARGSDPTWAQWAEHLATRLPYAGQWSVEEVPDGYPARRALSWLRQQASLHQLGQGLTQAKQDGTV